MAVIPASDLAEWVSLDAETGALTWLEVESAHWWADTSAPERNRQRWNTRNAGRPAFASPNGNGYCRGSIRDRKYYAHQVVFALANGHWAEMIDHIDGDGTNNRPDNLRECTTRQNGFNKAAFAQGVPGLPGVHGKVSPYKGAIWDKSIGRWRAYCSDGSGHRVYLGLFADDLAAARAYDAAAQRLHGEFARLNFPPECRW